MKSERLTRRTALALLAAAPLAGAPWIARAQTDASTIRIGSSANDQATPLLYAQHAGLFKKAGLNVDIQRMVSGSAIAAAVAGGSLDVGKAATIAVVTAFVKGLPFTLIAPTTLYRSEDPDVALIVPVASPVHSARDLNGKVLGVTSLVTIEMLGTRAWIDQNGGDAKTVRFVEVSSSAILASLEQGRIDAAPIYEPNLEQALNSGKARAIGYPYDAIAKRFEDSVWFADAGWVASHRDAAAQFSQVMHAASVYVAAHEAETLPLIADFAVLDVTTLTHMARPFPAPYLNASELQPVIDVAARYNVIPKSFPAATMISPAAARPRR